MKLTPAASRLAEFRKEHPAYESNDGYPDSEMEYLATMMGSENFSYALYEGGYLKPEAYIEGEDLIKLQAAIKLVEQFKDIVEELHEEF